MMRKSSLVLLGAAVGATLAFALSRPAIHGLSASAAPSVASEPYRQLELFGDVFEVIQKSYVEQPDTGKLVDSAIDGMLSSLDPHSSYMDAAAFRDMQADTSGEFGGLGLEVTMEEGLVRVVAALDDTPAQRAGIQANDIITELDGEPIEGLTLQQAVEKMRGPTASSIKLTIVHKGQDTPVDLTLAREIIHVRSVRSNKLDDAIGYVRITQFGEQTTAELKKAIADLGRQIAQDKLKGYVLDLRNNPGGLLEQAVSVANVFLNRGEIVSIRGRDPDENQRFEAKAHPGDLIKGKPLVVLINGGSASAAEIVAGALQDQRRATVLGSRSFGKGTVQTIIPLGDKNGAMRLTTARYFTPSGHSIQAQGIVPDTEVLQDVPDDLKARAETVSEATLRGHFKAEGQEQTGSQSYVPPDAKDDKALHAATDLLKAGGVHADLARPAKSGN